MLNTSIPSKINPDAVNLTVQQQGQINDKNMLIREHNKKHLWKSTSNQRNITYVTWKIKHQLIETLTFTMKIGKVKAIELCRKTRISLLN